MKSRRLKKILKIALIVIVACVVFGFVVQGLWNVLLPKIFGLHTITFWQGLGIFVLCKVLFGGPRPGGGFSWRRRMRERWESMTPEQRDKYRQAFEERCGHPQTPAAPET
jgi:Ca2+/H+ antiporter, TMEM165/GDT1 family